jgi:hypothetical protein
MYSRETDRIEVVMIANRVYSFALRFGWLRAAAVATLLLGPTLVWHAALRRPPIAAPRTVQLPLTNPTTEAKPRVVHADDSWDTSDLSRYESIVRVHSPDGEQRLLLTFRWPRAEKGIECVDRFDGSVRWHRNPARVGRYTYVEAGETTLVECTGYPQQNWLTVRRLSDGAVLGRPFEVGRLYDYGISGRQVATVEPIVILQGREIPVTSMGETPDGPEATRVQVYDEWGHVLRSLRVNDNAVVDGERRTRLFARPDGFVVVSKANRVAYLPRDGHRAALFH